MTFEDYRELRRRSIELFEQGVSITAIADQLGVEATVIYRWRNAYLVDIGQASRVSKADRAELAESRRVIARLEAELAEARRDKERLESQLAVALRANELLRDILAQPSDDPES